MRSIRLSLAAKTREDAAQLAALPSLALAQRQPPGRLPSPPALCCAVLQPLPRAVLAARWRHCFARCLPAGAVREPQEAGGGAAAHQGAVCEEGGAGAAAGGPGCRSGRGGGRSGGTRSACRAGGGGRAGQLSCRSHECCRVRLVPPLSPHAWHGLGLLPGGSTTHEPRYLHVCQYPHRLLASLCVTCASALQTLFFHSKPLCSTISFLKHVQRWAAGASWRAVPCIVGNTGTLRGGASDCTFACDYVSTLQQPQPS